jgi:hypothetical protein
VAKDAENFAFIMMFEKKTITLHSRKLNPNHSNEYTTENLLQRDESTYAFNPFLLLRNDYPGSAAHIMVLTSSQPLA